MDNYVTNTLTPILILENDVINFDDVNPSGYCDVYYSILDDDVIF